MRPESINREEKQAKPKVVKSIIQLLFSLIVLGCAVALASHYIKTSPKAKPRPRASKPPLVTVTQLKPHDASYTFEAMGTIVSAREIGITPRVSGEVVSISPDMVPGGHVAKGEELFTIDPADYEITILQLESDLAKAASDLNLEMGSQRIARKEYEILGQEVTKTEKDLMLRKPQLGIAKAAVAAAEAKLDRARLDLQRCKIIAPFNGVILAKNVDLGSRVNSNSSVGQLVGTDQFWVKVSVPVQQLKWLQVPSKISATGSLARIYLQDKNRTESYREGRVIRLAADLESEGRMAVLYVAINDPLCLVPANSDKPQLFLGSFVQVSFAGKKLSQVYAINRNYLHENDTIWLLNSDNTLDVKPIDILARNRTHVYSSTSLGQEITIITSQITTPTQGTALQLLGEKDTAKFRGANQ